jgi:hypothetical protein
MALVLKDRVKVLSTSTGQGTITLGAAYAGFQGFSAIGDGNTTYYCINNTANGVTEWEVGLGTYTSSGTTLSRDTVLASSAGGTTKTNFGIGDKEVFVTYPSEKAIYEDAVGYSNIPVTIGTTAIKLGETSLTLGGLTSVAVTQDPTTNLQVATKQYVDTLVSSGITFHAPVKYEVPNTTGNLTATYNNGTAGVGATLTNAGTQAAFAPDGPTASPSDRVLIYNQTNAFENGVYTVTTVGSGSTNWVLTRATDADSYGLKDPDALGNGDAFFVSSGDTGAGETYVCNTPGVITFGTTNITFVQISSTQIYSAGTGLTLSGTQFRITNTAVTAASYGLASKTLTATVNAQGQLTALADTDIAIASSAVSGLAASATTDTTNANNITSGTVNTARISGSYTGITGVGTLTAGTLGTGFTTVATTVGGTGITSFTSGGAVYATSTSALTTGTLPISAGGTNSTDTPTAGGVTYGTGTAYAISAAGTLNQVLLSGGTGAPTFTNQSSLSVGSATTAGSATNIAGGGTGQVPYNSASGVTTFLGLGSSGYVLTAGATAPTYVAQSTLSVGNATSAGTAANISGGIASQIPYQTGVDTTAFIANGTSGQILTSNGTSAPSWQTSTAASKAYVQAISILNSI